ncbi:hypothetical protein BC937DRAFT_91147 [Endogone sp. FLAS-F59071]|nr:hypothetical protein BC937DRAFT_91147 [Endogone sp. FLAS-F59071]|eukprot:RUS21896.1 hypothetical protein BC937DRAFT_91147 [Endogone sp. FLAS-F59071]
MDESLLPALDHPARPTPYSFGAKPRLKTSCLLCRTKKIRCDGEKPCARCKARNAECVYRESSGQVGRPPKNAVLNKMVSQRPKGATQNIFVLENLNWNAIREGAVLFNSRGPYSGSCEWGEDQKMIESLSSFYSRYFKKFSISCLPSDCLEDYPEYPVVSVRNSSLGFVFLREISSSVVMSDIVQMISTKISSLPVNQYGNIRHYSRNIARDTSTSFQDQLPQPAVSIPNPIKALSAQQALQLIDCFFYLHPFSIILNKTLVLQQFWTDTGDPLLYSAMFASASSLSNIPVFGKDKLNARPGEVFLAHAYSIITSNYSTYTLSKLQAFIILAWHENTIDNGKKGTSLMAMAWNTIAKMGIRNQDSTIETEASKHAGLHPLERELRNNCFWVLWIITSWGCLQIDQPPRAVFRTHYINLPCISEIQSESCRLDEESGNSIPFQSQTHSTSAFFAAAKVAEVTTKIWMLLPEPSVNLFLQHEQVFEGTPTPSAKGKFHSDAVKLLIEFRNSIPTDLDQPTRYPLLISYHILTIHVRFPVTTPNPSSVIPSVPTFPNNTHQIAQKELDIANESANAILDLTQDIFAKQSIQLAPRLTAFALDTAAKVYMLVIMRHSGGIGANDAVLTTFNGISPERDNAQRALQHIYTILKTDECLRTNAKVLKKSVKAFLIQIGAWIASDNAMGNISHSMMMMSLASISQSVVEHKEERMIEMTGISNEEDEKLDLQMDLNELAGLDPDTMMEQFEIMRRNEGLFLLTDREGNIIQDYAGPTMSEAEAKDLESKIYFYTELAAGARQETSYNMTMPSPIASSISPTPSLQRDLAPVDTNLVPTPSNSDLAAEVAKLDFDYASILEPEQLTPNSINSIDNVDLMQKMAAGIGWDF